jgi:hypothetical protein
MDEHDLVRAIRTTGTYTVVAPEFGEHYFALNHALRKVSKHQLLDVTWPQFSTLTAEHKPFLLYAKTAVAQPDLAGEGTGNKELAEKLKSKHLNLSDYEFTPLIAHQGGPFRGGQPNPGVYLYLFQAKHSPRAVAVRTKTH